MAEKRYTVPEDKTRCDMAAEPAVAAYQENVPQDIRVLRHNVMDAVYASNNVDLLYTILESLNKDATGKAYKSKYACQTDEELAAELSQYSDWNDMEHADLSQIDYSKYKPYRSEKNKKLIAKWL